jgi:hypothetical protein
MNNPVIYSQGEVTKNSLFVMSFIFKTKNTTFFYNSIISTKTRISDRTINWSNNVFQIPIWISSLMFAADFGSNFVPALQTLYQYIKYPGVIDLNKLYGLKLVPSKLNTACKILGAGLLLLNIGISGISNFKNDNLTLSQKWTSFGIDTAYILGTFGVGYGVGALVSLIPVVGPFIAPFAAAGATWLIDWTNKEYGWLDDVKQWFYNL